jgi:hypothetical protein
MKKTAAEEPGVMCKSISTSQRQTPLFIKSRSRIAQILLLSGMDGPFCTGHFNPFEKLFFYNGFGE